MDCLLKGRVLRWTRLALCGPSTRHGKKRAQNKFLKPTNNNNSKYLWLLLVLVELKLIKW
jgi:hypothetical protein